MDDPQTEENFEALEATRRADSRAALSFLGALGVLVLGGGIAAYFYLTKEPPEQEENMEIVPTVRVSPIERGTHRVTIETQGVVESLREVDLAAEVSGRVRAISPQLINGGIVSEGEVLVELDHTDFLAALERAKSDLADAQLALTEEQAQAAQAARDWEKLGRGEPSDLALRKPQLTSAKARVAAAEAEVARAERDLERTKIRAPFDARVRRAAVEVGAVVTTGTAVATLFSATELEVRLPFTLRDYGMLDHGAEVAITLQANLGGNRVTWPARLDRLTGEVERSTLSAYGIARVEANADGSYPPVGLFVEATVPGQQLNEVVEIPRAVVRGGEVIWVENDGRLAKRAIDVLQPRRATLIVQGDFQENDRLVLTRLAAPLEGMQVEVVDDPEPSQPAD